MSTTMSTTATGPHVAAVEEQYCTFYVADLFFGVAVAEVQEVLRHQPMTPVPRAAGAVTGLINLRGQIVTAIDLRHRLGLPPRERDRLPMNVIVRTRGEVISLLVDDIGDVIDLTGPTGAAAEPAPSNLPARLQEMVSEVRPLAASILLVLDVDSAVDVTASHPSGGHS